jgi:hypothetical protein
MARREIMEDFERPARTALRYPVTGPAFFRWKDANGKEHEGAGSSRDVSKTGAFVLTAAAPPVGADIDLLISFVALRNAMTTEPVQLVGRVLRVEQIAADKGIKGFAVLTKEVIFPGRDESSDQESPGGINTPR